MGRHHERVGDGPVQQEGDDGDVQLGPHDALRDESLVDWAPHDLREQRRIQGLDVHPHQGHHLCAGKF